jgi:hypothetical protein
MHCDPAMGRINRGQQSNHFNVAKLSGDLKRPGAVLTTAPG